MSFEHSFARERHIQYFLYHLKSLPRPYGTASLDTSRLTVLYFCLSALDVLDALDTISDSRRASIISWVYSLQVLPDPVTGSVERCGFRGSQHISGVPFSSDNGCPSQHALDEAHVTMTYTALCVLAILRDDWTRLHRSSIIGALRSLQQADGSFQSVFLGGECDMRFVYCAFAISSMLQDWSGFDVSRSVGYIASAQAYDGAVGLCPGSEGHGGSTYCAIASLFLAPADLVGDLGGLGGQQSPEQVGAIDLASLKRWCIDRQTQGFSGRPNKPADTCYSFWIGATLQMLNVYSWTQSSTNRCFNLSCQGSHGGFSKVAGVHADVLHSYMGLCGLSLMAQLSQSEDSLNALQPLYVPWGLTMRTRAFIHTSRDIAREQASAVVE